MFTAYPKCKDCGGQMHPMAGPGSNPICYDCARKEREKLEEEVKEILKALTIEKRLSIVEATLVRKADDYWLYDFVQGYRAEDDNS